MELVETDTIDESDPIWGLVMSQSRKSPMRFKLGAAIIKRGKLIGFGYNSRKTHPKFGTNDNFRTLHAEGSALYSCHLLGNDPAGATIIIYRKGGRMSKPCEHCMEMLAKAGIKKVIYTNETGNS